MCCSPLHCPALALLSCTSKLHGECVKDFARDQGSCNESRLKRTRKIVLRAGTTVRGRLATYRQNFNVEKLAVDKQILIHE